MHFTIEDWREVYFWFDKAVTTLTLIAGVYSYKKLSFPAKVVFWGILITAVIESIIDELQKRFLGITPVMYVCYFSDVVETALFFNYCIPRFRKIRLGIYILLAGILYWLVNTIFFQPITFDDNLKKNSYFYYEAFNSITFVALSLVTLYYMFKETSFKQLRNNPLFALILILMFGRGLIYIYDITIPFVTTLRMYIILSMSLEWLPNDLFILATGFIFLQYRKKYIAIEH